MRADASYDDTQTPPVLRLWVHGAPHRRDHEATLKVYRLCILMACHRAGVITPIDHPIYLKVEFIDPTSPDLGNLYLALERVLDGSNNFLGRKAVLTDDSLIKHVTMGIFENAHYNEIGKTRMQLPRFVPAEAVA
jgi:hypothetical protein